VVRGTGFPAGASDREFWLRSLREQYRASIGGLEPVFWILWWGTLVNRLANFTVTFLAMYLMQKRGFSAATAGRVVALYGLGGTLASPLGGVLADRLGRRATMLSGLTLSALSVGLLPFAQAPIILAGLASLAGASSQIYHPAVSAAVADVVPLPDRRRAYGLLYWAINMGLTLGYAVASVVASRNLSALFLADAATTLVCAALIAAVVGETRPEGLSPESVMAGLRLVFSDAVFLVFLGLHLIALVVFTQWQLALPLDLARHGFAPGTFASLMAFNCMGVVLLQPWLTPLLRRFEGAHLLATSALLFGAGFGVNAFAIHLPLYLLGVTLWTVGEVVGFPVASTLVADLAPASLRGRYQGAFSMVWGLAFTLSPIAAGELLDHAGARALWGLCFAAGATIAAGHLAAAGPRRRRLSAAKRLPVSAAPLSHARETSQGG